MNYRKITQEEFNKLPQLDRIELRQRKFILDENKIEVAPFSFLHSMIVIFSYLVLLIFVIFGINQESAMALFPILIVFPKIVILGFVFLTILDILFSIRHYNKIRRLYSEYFEQTPIKTTVRKKK